MISWSFQSVRRMREAWKRETCSVSVFFVRVGSQLSPRRGEQYQSNSVSQGKQRQSNPYPMPCLPPPPRPPCRHDIDRCITCPLFFFNRVFRQERFKRFLWLLGSLITNGATLRKCYLFSCRCKNVPYRQMFKTAFLQKKMSTTWKLYDRFFLILENKPQSSLVLYLKVWSRSWRTKCWSGLTVKCNANAKRICESWRTNRGRVSRLSTDYLHPQGLFLPNALLQETE